MKNKKRFKFSNPSGIVILPFLTVFFVSFFSFSGNESYAQEKVNRLEDILPSNTIFYACTDDLSLAKKNASTMPLYKILQEKEVIDFLEKPKRFIHDAIEDLKNEAEKDETIKKIDLDFDKYLNADIGRVFIALTHVTIPNLPSNNTKIQPSSLVPDFGFVIGVDYKNPDQNLIQFIKKSVVLISKEKGFPIQLSMSEYNGVSFEKVILPLPFPVATPCFFKLGKMDVFTTSINSMKAILDRQSGLVVDSLSKIDNFREGVKYVDFSDPSATRSYLNVKMFTSLLEKAILFSLKIKAIKDLNYNNKIGLDESSEQSNKTGLSEKDQPIRDRFLKDFPSKLEKLIDLLGIRNLDSVFSSDISKEGLATSVKYVSFDGPEKGLFSLSPDVQISEEKLKLIPKESTSFSISQFDTAGLYDLILESVKTFDEETHSKIIGALKWFSVALAGKDKDKIVDIRNDILGSLGTEFITYKLKARGMSMMGAPPVFFFVSVKDYDRFSSSVKSFIGGLKNIKPDARSPFLLKTVNFENHEICYVQFQELPIPIQPSFTKIGNYAVFSFDAKELKKLIKTEGVPKESILENKEFIKNYQRIPSNKKIVKISFTNVAEEFGSAYEQITPMIPIMTMGIPPEINLPFDFMLLPTSESITKHLFSALTVGYREGKGWKTVHYGPFGPELGRVLIPASVAGIIAGVYYYRQSQTKIEKIKRKRFEKKEGKGTGKSSKEMSDLIIKARKDLGSLAGACMVYSIAHRGTYPDSLENLLIPTDEYPEGFFPPKKIPNDPWGNPYHYKKIDSGKNKYMIWSFGPNGKDESGKGDDIVKIK